MNVNSIDKMSLLRSFKAGGVPQAIIGTFKLSTSALHELFAAAGWPVMAINAPQAATVFHDI